jgi:hypothetical protein
MHITHSTPATISHHTPAHMFTNTQHMQVPSPHASVTSNQAAVANAGTMRISRYENGEPVYNWKSNNQEEPTLVQKLLGEDMFIGMSVATTVMMGLKLTGVVATAGMGTLAVAATMIIPSLVGASIGAMINKSKVERQHEEGIEFTPPSQGITSGAGLTLMSGFLLHKLASTSTFSFLGNAAEAMAPNAIGAAGLAAMSSFAVPIVIAAGVGLYMAYKNSKEQKESAELRYQQAEHIYAVQQGHSKEPAPVKELEEHVANTLKRDYTPEATLVAGTLVGATALHALTGTHAPAGATGTTHQMSLDASAAAHHSSAHLAAEVAHETANHTLHHAANHTAHGVRAVASNAAQTSPSVSFVERYASQRPDAAMLHTERLALASDTPSLARGA